MEACTLSSSLAFPRHSHDQFGIGLIDAGAQRSWSGIGPVEACAGDVITVNPGEMHDGLPVDGQIRRWRMLYWTQGAAIDGRPGPIEFTHPVVTAPHLATRFARLFHRVTEPHPDPLAAEVEVELTLMLLLRRYGGQPVPVRHAPPHVARALQRLDDAPAQSPSLAELAALSGVSRFQLLRGFARAVGTTPHAYLMQRRVRLARHLLRCGRSPADAAAEAGFADQSHLTRAFRRQLGITPARYRAATA